MQALLKDTKVKRVIQFYGIPSKEQLSRLLNVIHNKKNLTTINFNQDRSGWAEVPSEFWRDIFAAIQQNENIKFIEFDINLDRHKMSREQILAIAEGIGNNPHLENVSFGCNLQALDLPTI